MKKGKWMIFLILAVVIFFVFKGGLKFGGSTMAAGDISSAIVTRQFSATEVQPSQTFTVTYATSGVGAGSWGVLISDTITGGCSPTTFNDARLSTSLSDVTKTYTAPASGTCTFTGTYTYSGTTIGTAQTIQGTTIISVISCSNLMLLAQTAITSWTSNPIATTKTAALTAIQNWATRC